MHEIHGPYTSEDNVLKHGPLHKCIITHIDTLIQEPELLLSPKASFEKGSFDGRWWEHPKHSMQLNLML